MVSVPKKKRKISVTAEKNIHKEVAEKKIEWLDLQMRILEEDNRRKKEMHDLEMAIKRERHEVDLKLFKEKHELEMKIMKENRNI